jgi:hypothetical protein
MSTFLQRIALLTILALCAPAWAAEGDEHLFLGNPSGANSERDNYLLRKKQYVLSYNSARGHPELGELAACEKVEGDRPSKQPLRP